MSQIIDAGLNNLGRNVQDAAGMTLSSAANAQSFPPARPVTLTHTCTRLVAAPGRRDSRRFCRQRQLDARHCFPAAHLAFSAAIYRILYIASRTSASASQGVFVRHVGGFVCMYFPAPALKMLTKNWQSPSCFPTIQFEHLSSQHNTTGKTTSNNLNCQWMGEKPFG